VKGKSALESKRMDVFSGEPQSVDTDLVIIPVFEGTASLRQWGEATGGEIERALAEKEFTGKLFATFVTPITDARYRARRVGVIGLGPQSAFTVDVARRAASAAALMARQRKIGRIAFCAAGALDSPDLIQAIAEGLTLAEFDPGHYKTGNDDKFRLRSVAIIVGAGSRERGAAAVRRGRIIGDHCNMARRLDNEPGNALTPSVFADQIVGLVRGGGLAVDLLDHAELERLGMGMLLGVGRGSAEPPRLVVIRHQPAAAPPAPVLGLVGKGITFDTGGISIKPALDMGRMKDDMAGGAAVACALRAIAALEVPVRVIGIVPIAENMPGGRAIRPGDVLKAASGKTVEVVNTDAEGRLILGDALWYAQKLGATHLVDIATLTGAISVALGRITTGLFGTPPAFVEHVREVAERAGDRAWPLPLFEEYKDDLRSDIADMINTAGRHGGAITAAMFLKEFTGGLPWIHLDIAGTSWAEESKPYMSKGPTGVGVRTLIEIASALTSWKLG
jgi:leucyl aminopeptidase